MFPVPRATYYFKCKTAFRSLVSIFSNQHRKKDATSFAVEFGKFIGAKEVILTSHARIALWTILNSLNYEEGSEVLMTPVNLPDMVNMILLNKMRPRFVDFEKKSLNVDTRDLKSKMTPRTKVLFVTVLNGITINLDEVIEIARANNLIVVMDLTQSMGMEYKGKKIASLADYCIYSLCDLKDIHTHRGGVIAYNNTTLTTSLRTSLKKIESTPDKKYFLGFVFEDLFSTVLLKRSFFAFALYPLIRILLSIGLIDSLEEITKGNGVKIFNINIGRGLWGGDGDLIRTDLPPKLTYYYTDMQAQIGLEQLRNVQRRQSARIANAQTLIDAIKNKDLLFYENEDSLFWKFPIWTGEKQKLKKYLIKRGIDCAPSNLPLLSEMDIFKRYHQDKTPNAREYTDSTLNLPAHYYLNTEDIAVMAETLNGFFHQ